VFIQDGRARRKPRTDQERSDRRWPRLVRRVPCRPSWRPTRAAGPLRSSVPIAQRSWPDRLHGRPALQCPANATRVAAATAAVEIGRSITCLITSSTPILTDRLPASAICVTSLTVCLRYAGTILDGKEKALKNSMVSRAFCGCGGSQPPRPTFDRDFGLIRRNPLIYKEEMQLRSLPSAGSGARDAARSSSQRKTRCSPATTRVRAHGAASPASSRPAR
jgi:hypothetical protein